FSSISTFTLIFYSKKWGYNISFDTVFIFSTGLMFVDFGFLLALIFRKKSRVNISSSDINLIKSTQYSLLVTVIAFMFQLVVMFIFMKYGSNYLQVGVGLDSFSESVVMLKAARAKGDIESLGVLQYALT